MQQPVRNVGRQMVVSPSNLSRIVVVTTASLLKQISYITLSFIGCHQLAVTANKLCERPPQYALPLQVDLSPFDLESDVRVTCDVGYLCGNFSLPTPLCSRLRPDVRDRQTSDAHHRLMSLPRSGGIIIAVMTAL